jgi:hypothetical protein
LAKELNRYFEVFRRNSDLYESEYQLDENGREVFRTTQRVEFIVGSGANGFTCIVRRGDYLFEAPLSFYTRPNRWALSPGYEVRDYGFDRPIYEGCVVCHSGRAQPVSGADGLYRNPPFQELAIGCENCHGPGELHVRERTEGAPVPLQRDSEIVNPAKLTPFLTDNICMYCHQAGDVRMLQPGKSYLDFRPGTPLDDTLAIFMIPLKREAPPQSDLLEHNFSMRLSKCYRGSDGKLSCLSCHDPHVQPAKPDAAAYYRKKCMGCHTDSSCALPVQARLRLKPPNDCAGCHMPKRDVKVIAHSALTNHRIIADDEEAYPEEAFHLTSPAASDLVHLTAVPGRKDYIPLITLLQTYGELMDSAPGYRQQYLALLAQLAKSQPDNIAVLEALARGAIQRGNSEGDSAAIQYLSRAIELGSRSPRDFQALAALLSRGGRLSDATDLLRRAIQVVPYDSELYVWLANAYVAEQKRAEALETLKRAAQIFPQDSAIRLNLERIEGRPNSPDYHNR